MKSIRGGTVSFGKKHRIIFLIMLVAVSAFLFSVTVMAEPINWTTQQYRAYAYAGNYDYGYDTTETFGPPLPLEAVAWGGRDCILGQGEACISASSNVSYSNMLLTSWKDPYYDSKSAGTRALAEGSFSGSYSADMPYFSLLYDLSAGDSITVNITDLTSATSLYSGTISAGSSTLTDTLYVNTPVGHNIRVSFSSSIEAPRASYDSANISYSMGSVAWPAFTPVSGTWQFEGGEYSGSGSGTNISLRNNAATTDNMVIESDVFINPDGASQNAFIIFDYQSPTEFKYAYASANGDHWGVGYYNGSYTNGNK